MNDETELQRYVRFISVNGAETENGIYISKIQKIKIIKLYLDNL